MVYIYLGSRGPLPLPQPASDGHHTINSKAQIDEANKRRGGKQRDASVILMSFYYSHVVACVDTELSLPTHD